jgi:hypothetical protein
MPSKRVIAAVAVMVLTLGACGGHERRVSASSHVSATPSALPVQAVKGAPRVILQVGTSFQDGTLVQYCDGGSCKTGSPRVGSTLSGSDPLLFIIDQRPSTARAQLSSGSTVVDARALHPGTTMLYAPAVGPGSYMVRLDASYKGRSASWVFRVKVVRASR